MRKLLLLALVFVCGPVLAGEPPSRFGVDAPELAHLGDYAVGVKTMHLVQHGQSDVLGYDAAKGTAPLADRALTVAPGQTPNLVNLNPYPTNQTVNQWVNPAAFAVPALGTYGNLGYNNMKGPGVFQLNMALSRTFPIRERKTIQLRAEAFNLPNHLNPSTPNTSPLSNTTGISALNVANFGQITNDISGNNGLNSGDYRIVQLAMKFVF